MSPYSSQNPICRFYLSNTCARGNACKFEHPTSQPIPAKKSAFGPIVTCRFFSAGQCRAGSQCRFYHPPLPVSGVNRNVVIAPSIVGVKASLVPISSSEELSTTVEPCKFFPLGRCTKGNACAYPHVIQDRKIHASIKVPMVPDKAANEGRLDCYDHRAVKSALPDLESMDSKRSLKDVNDVERTLLGCRVQFGTGALIQQITTAFESHFVMLTGIPPIIAQHGTILAYAEKYGSVLDLSLTEESESNHTARIKYVTSTEARSAAQGLHDKLVQSVRLTARVDLRAVESGPAVLRSTKVKVSWYAPSGIAWAHYHNISDARANASRLDGMVFANRKIRATFQVPSFRQRESFSVVLKRLPLYVNPATLKKISSATTVTVSEKPIYSPSAALSKLQSLLSEYGTIEAFDVLPRDRNKPKVVAFAQFTSAEAAEKAVKCLNGTQQECLNRGPIWLEHIHSMKFLLSRALFTTLKVDLNALVESVVDCKLRYYEVDVETDQPVDPVCVRLYGTHPKALGRAKMQLDRILCGEPFADSQNDVIWEDYFATAPGAFFLRNISQKYSAHVTCDSRLRTLRLFGKPGNKEEVKKELHRKISEMRERNYTIALEREDVRALITGGLQRIVDDVGEDKVILDISKRTLTIVADMDDVRKIRESIQATRGMTVEELLDDNQDDCPVCFCETTDAIRLDCNHTYCRSCLQHLLQTTPPANFVGMRCIMEVASPEGTPCTCGALIPFRIIRDLLSPSAEDRLLEAALLSFVHARPQEFHYCPTPDCPIIYREGVSGIVLRCPTCIARICAACHIEFHEGQTCDEYRDETSAGHIAYKKWREANGIKACPKCGTDLEKNGGCNHMTCTRCGTHMCWICMKTFEEVDSGKGVYAHMRREHGGIM
ncbi:hypothetical protein K474DRAFT_864478 [Panus rudis PR-1116 ss-1]|nr:hypothetical protein K474DRAFT_864478 [Panus rudis PR-1116 ss-1]